MMRPRSQPASVLPGFTVSASITALVVTALIILPLAVLVFRAASKLKLIMDMNSVYSGAHLKNPLVSMHRAKMVEVRPKGDLPANASLEERAACFDLGLSTAVPNVGSRRDTVEEFPGCFASCS